MGASFAVVDVVRHRRPTAADAPRGARKFSTAADSSPPPARGPASHPRVRVRYFYPNLASTSVGSHSTAATSSSPPTSSRPSSKPTRKPPPRKSSRQFPLNPKEDAPIGHPLFLLHNKPGRNALLVMSSCRKFCDNSLENR